VRRGSPEPGVLVVLSAGARRLSARPLDLLEKPPRPAVNLVGRVEPTAKTLNTPIVLSDDFARAYGKPLISLGHYPLHGLAKPHELFVRVIGSQPIRASS